MTGTCACVTLISRTIVREHMPVHQIKKQSDLEKRLKHLEFQLYGKKEKLDVRSEKIDKEAGSLKLEIPTSNIKLHNPSSNLQHPTSSSDITYLRHDLTKILILSGLAVGAQLLLYLSSRSNLLRLF